MFTNFLLPLSRHLVAEVICYMNDANFILVCCPRVLGKFIMVQVTVVVLSFAAPCYNTLSCQIYDVCKTSVGTKNSEVQVNVIVCELT